MFVALLMVGCGGPDLDDKETLDGIIAEAIDEEKLQKRGQKGEELRYAPNEDTPYTGWTKAMWGNGQIKFLMQYKDGKMDGLGTRWYENGQKQAEGNYKDGKLDGLWTDWYENGQKELEANWKDDKEEGLWTSWYENGQKESEQNYKEGKPMSVVVWKPNGEMCPVTNLKNGNGILVWYRDDGTVDFRVTIKDGELVKD